MADTNFTDGNKAVANRIVAAWLNDVNKLRYQTGDATRGAALLDTVQSGTGAVARSVQDALRAIARSGDFDTTPHFQTRAGNLTETIGLSSLAIASGQTSFPSTTIASGGTSPLQIIGQTGQRLNVILDSVGDTTGQAHAEIFTRRSRGTTSLPSALINGDPIGGIAAIGYGSTGYGDAVTDIVALATENWSDTAQGTRISISTVANGTVLLREVLSLNQDRTIFTYDKLYINKNAQGSASLVAAPTGALLHIAQADGANASAVVDVYGTGTQSRFVTRTARGTGVTPTAVKNGDILGIFGAVGFGATVYSTATMGAMVVSATQDWTDAAQGAQVEIFTTPNGSTSLAAILTLGQDKSAKFVGKIFPGTDAGAAQTAAGQYAGTGVPSNANGNNGDFYNRSDGTVAGNNIHYHKEAGAWVAYT